MPALIQLAALTGSISAACASQVDAVPYDVVIRHGTIYDGTRNAPFVGDIAFRCDRIAFVGRHAAGRANEEVDAKGLVVAPGFINMLSHAEESLIADGRALSDLKQGITLEVFGEDSMGPLNDLMKSNAVQRQGDIHYAVDWTSLGQYLEKLEKRGVTPNVGSFVGAATVRVNVLGEGDVQPTPSQLAAMRLLVRQSMEEGALGVTTALIYSPNEYAKTSELIDLAKESARCGGIYIAHMRSEGDKIEQALQETIAISRASGAPAEIYHLKVAGSRNWSKLDKIIAMVEAARKDGHRISADMYMYTAGATGLDASMPPWVQDGGLEMWIQRLKDPGVRSRLIKEMRDPDADWENLYLAAGADGVLLLGFKNPDLKPLAGKTLAAVAMASGVSPEEEIINLISEDGSRVGAAYFLMSEENVARESALPWVSFGSDEGAPAPEGVFLESQSHPRAYGNVARLLAHYVRERHALTLQQAIIKLTSLPAHNLSLAQRGTLQIGNFADVVIFDVDRIQDHSTYERPAQLATGMRDVWVNGGRALRNGEPTDAHTGRAIRGRAWTGAKNGGCRGSAAQWTWSP